MYCKYDIKLGIRRDFYKYFVIAGITLFACADYYIKQTNSFEITHTTAVFSDYLFSFFSGSSTHTSGNGVFDIPILWLVVQIFLVYLIGKYPKENLYGSGVNALLKSQSRISWWLSKCLWCVLTCVIYYAVIAITILLFCMTAKVSIDFVLHNSGNSTLFLYSTEVAMGKLLSVMLLPLMCWIALSLLQLTVMFFTSPIYSIIFSAVILISSTYFYTPFLIGNISMLARNEIFSPNGVSTVGAYVICFALSVISVIVGAIHFSHSDILGKE